MDLTIDDGHYDLPSLGRLPGNGPRDGRLPGKGPRPIPRWPSSKNLAIGGWAAAQELKRLEDRADEERKQLTIEAKSAAGVDIER